MGIDVLPIFGASYFFSTYICSSYHCASYIWYILYLLFLYLVRPKNGVLKWGPKNGSLWNGVAQENLLSAGLLLRGTGYGPSPSTFNNAQISTQICSRLNETTLKRGDMGDRGVKRSMVTSQLLAAGRTLKRSCGFSF